MNGELSGQNMGYFAAALLGLLIFGYLFDRLTEWTERNTEGYTAFLVVAGVAVTLGVCIPFIGLYNTALVVAAFIFSGLPMIIGSVLRQAKKNRAELERIRKAADDGNQAETLAE